MHFLAEIVLALLAQAPPSPWVVQPSGTTERLRGVAAVSDSIAWASGNRGTCLRTVDAGTTWTKIPAADAAGLDFRDVEAFDADRAYVLAIGPGEASRIFKSTRLATGAVALVECYRNQDPKGFLDAIAFWDHDHGLALGDPVDGRFVILATDDAGRSWTQLSDPGTMPPALPNEGAFAASGTCLVVGADGQAWFGTGGAAKARVFRSRDKGRSWAAAETPVDAGVASRGIFGLSFGSKGREGIAIGGDYKATNAWSISLARTDDAGDRWAAPEEMGAGGGFIPGRRPGGFRSAAVQLPGSVPGTILAIGPTGTDLAEGGGLQWRRLAGEEGYHALAIAPSGRFAWAVGEGGKIGRLDVAEALKGR